jgi:hypothetical protein
MNNNNRFDENNYTKHPPVIVYSDNQKLDKLFSSNLLLIRWKVHGNKKRWNGGNGMIEQSSSTPLGDLIPVLYSLPVSIENKPLIQFLAISLLYSEYRLSFSNPNGLEKSSIEIWEFNNPYQNNVIYMSGTSNQQGTDPQLLQTLVNSNAQLLQAVGTLTTVETAQLPGAQTFSNDSIEIPIPKVFAAANPPTIPADPKNRTIKITNLDPGAQIKVFLKPPADGTTYAAATNYFDVPIQNGSAEIEEPMSRGAIWLLSSKDLSKVAIATTKQLT